MKTTILVAAFAALAAAVPSVNINRADRYSAHHQKRAPVFKDLTYNELSISGGTSGQAAAEAEAKLAGLPTDLTAIDKADLTFLNSVNQIANDAEIGAFNQQIVAVGVGEEALALQRGKVKNKVLKLTATVKKLTAQQAQGKNVTEKLDAETVKLNKNIALDVKDAGLASTLVEFDANTKDPEASNVEKNAELADQAIKIIEQSGGVA